MQGSVKNQGPRAEPPTLDPIEVYFNQHPITVYVIPLVKTLLGGAWMIIFFISMSIVWIYLRVFFRGFKDEDEERTYREIFERETMLRFCFFFILYFLTTGVLAWLPATSESLKQGLFIAGFFFLLRYLRQDWQSENSRLKKLLGRVLKNKEKLD